jgi:DNA mismatch repair protein MutS
MAQYQRIKAQHPDALLLFRVGDFYETFGADAIQASSVLGITLTKRANGAASEVELAGFPYHSLDAYLPRLVRAGVRVAVCEQLEDPKLAKTVVRRGVTELITPGLATGEKVLDQRSNHFLAALAEVPATPGGQTGSGLAIALLDLSTGQFLAGQGDEAFVDRVLESHRPAEVLVARSRMKAFQARTAGRYYAYPQEDWIFSPDFGAEKLIAHFRTNSLKGFGMEGPGPVSAAAGAILHYLGQTEHHQLTHITGLRRLLPGEHMVLDRFTLRNLELLQSLQPGGKSLLDVLDRTLTPMGARLLRRWLVQPLLDTQRMEQRLDAVEFWVREADCRSQLETGLRSLGDIERTLARIAMGKGLPRDLGQVRSLLQQLPAMIQLLSPPQSQAVLQMGQTLDACAELLNNLSCALADELPAQLGKGVVIREGFNQELDQLRGLGQSGREYLASLQAREAERSGIPSLKVGFNGVFGYYLEVTRRYRDQVPQDWIRKQTLVNAERFITPELKEYEEKILGAEERISNLENSLFQELCEQVRQRMESLQKNARILARADVLLTFARNALDFHYRRPRVDSSDVLELTQSRHPVIERLLPAGQTYVPNDVVLNRSEQQMLLISGPNMSGKSAVLRQTALLVLMAQCGSFVPAASARIGLVDQLFTRVGASDNISAGESTFMVEMLETASIANNLSERSLLVLDEIGRGTSTYDGISIAWSLIEYLHDYRDLRPRTLFATHYHELAELADRLPRVHNYHIATRESGEQVIFLRKLEPGPSQRSFGIHVAAMAGMPASLVCRARDLLRLLEEHGMGLSSDAAGQTADTLREAPPPPYQLSLFEISDPALGAVREALSNLDTDNMTPVESLLKIRELQALLKVK